MFSSPGAPIRGARTACAHPSTHPSTHPSIRPAGCTPGGGPKLFPLLSNPISVPKGSGLGALPVPPSPRRAEHPTAPEGGKRPTDGSKAKPQLATGVEGMMDVSVRMRASPRYGTAKPMRAGGHCALRAPPLLEMWVPSLKLRLPHSCRSAMQNISPPPSPPSPPPNPRLALLEQKKTHS